MKLWIDDVRPAPQQEGKWPDNREWLWVKSVKEAIATIQAVEFFSFLCGDEIELIDIDHDAGDYASDGGDYIKLLDWLEETGRNYPIRIHSMNPVGVANMRAIIEKNGWKEIR
jgi:hypothetical protein